MTDAPGWLWPTEADKHAAKTNGERLSWTRWAARYEIFRLLGVGRSLLAVYNHEREDKGKKPARSTPSSWGKMAKRWDWPGRAALWDAHVQAQARQEEAAARLKDRTEARDVRRRLIQTGYALLLQAMANTQSEIDDVQIARLMTAIHRHNEESRAEYGDLPTQDITINGTVGTYQMSADDLAKARRDAENFERSMLAGDE